MKGPSVRSEHPRAEGKAPPAWLVEGATRAPVIDAHTHIFPTEIIRKRQAIAARDKGFAKIYADPKAIMANHQALLKYMEEERIEVSVVCGFPFKDKELLRLTNDCILHVAEGRESIIPLASIHMEDEETAAHEAERCLKLGAKGIGEIALYEKDLKKEELEKLDRIADLAAVHNAVLLLHMNEQVGHAYRGKATIDFGDVSDFIMRHQDVRIVLAHLGGGLCFYEFMPEIRKGFSGVFYDTAALPYLYSQEVCAFIEKFLADKTLFGSDYPLLSFKRYDKTLHNLDEVTRVKILGENARKVFSRG